MDIRFSFDKVAALYDGVRPTYPDRLFDDIMAEADLVPGAWGLPPESWYLPGGPVSRLFDASGYFLPVIHKAYPWRWRLSTPGYIDFLKTRSDLQLLTTEQREALLPAFAKAIEAEGGMIEVQYEAHLYMAKAA